MKECPSCNASVPDSADVCPSCSLEFGDDEGDARKTMLGMSFASDREESGDASSTADGTPDQEMGQTDSDEPDREDKDAEELLFNLDFRRPRDDENESVGDESDEDDQPLRVPDDASPTGTLRGTGSEVTDADEEPESGDRDDISANPATRTHDGLPEFEPGRVFGGGRSREDVPQGKGTGDDTADGEADEEPSPRVDAGDLDSVREAFQRRGEEALSERAEKFEEASEGRPSQSENSDNREGPRAEDFSETPGSGIFKVPKKKGKSDDGRGQRTDTKPGHASEQSGSGIIKPASSKKTESPQQDDADEDDDESDLMGDNTYFVRDEGEDDGSVDDAAVRQTAQVADSEVDFGGWSRADETARIGPDEQDDSEQESPDSLVGETDVISEGTQREAATWVALVAGALWVIAADTIWITASFDTAAVQAKFAAAMIGGIWGLFGTFLADERWRAYGHVVIGSVAGSAFAATLAATGLALGDLAGLLGAVVLIVAGVLED